MIDITIEVARAAARTIRVVAVEEGTLVRELLRQIGQPSEGCAVLVDGVSVPRDLPLRTPTRLTVVPTFSGG